MRSTACNTPAHVIPLRATAEHSNEMPTEGPRVGFRPTLYEGCVPMDTVHEQGLERFATVRLTSDLSALTPRERAMIPLLVEAAEHMDAIYWLEMVGPREAVLDPIDDPSMRRRVEINYCPWDRVDADRPFV